MASAGGVRALVVKSNIVSQPRSQFGIFRPQLMPPHPRVEQRLPDQLGGIDPPVPLPVELQTGQQQQVRSVLFRLGRQALCPSGILVTARLLQDQGDKRASIMRRLSAVWHESRESRVSAGAGRRGARKLRSDVTGPRHAEHACNDVLARGEAAPFPPPHSRG